MSDKIKSNNRYLQLIEKIFFDRYNDGDNEINFERKDIKPAAEALGIEPRIQLRSAIPD
ncbi:hypothetical protein [Aeromonas salmonicida]|uniref:hypothetical protein n=1 Tax=Aeromonas salmonicida TaxID=645 RepID=UPI000AA34BF8|nr:hypothetical protein [Aeromonas salmonicida]